MLKGSGLIRAYPRLNARVRQTKSQPVQTIFHVLWSSAGSLCLLFMGLIIAVLFVVHIAAPEVTADAFTPYQMVYPGLVLSDLGSSACSVHTISQYTHEEECDLRLIQPGADTFRKVTITLYSGQIRRITFLCSDILVGDLVQRWGRPDAIIPTLKGYMLRWSKKGITAGAPARQWFNYQLPVETVILT